MFDSGEKFISEKVQSDNNPLRKATKGEAREVEVTNPILEEAAGEKSLWKFDVKHLRLWRCLERPSMFHEIALNSVASTSRIELSGAVSLNILVGMHCQQDSQ